MNKTKKTKKTARSCSCVYDEQGGLLHTDAECSAHPASTKEPPILSDVKVRLTGKNGNAFVVLGEVQSAMNKAGHGNRVDEFLQEAMGGDYDHLLRTCMKWVHVS